MKLIERLKAKQAAQAVQGGIVDDAIKAEASSFDTSAGDDKVTIGTLSFDAPDSTSFIKLVEQETVAGAIKAKLDKGILSNLKSTSDPFAAEHQTIQKTSQKMVALLGLPDSTFDIAVDFSMEKAPSCTCSFYLSEAQLQLITGSTAPVTYQSQPLSHNQFTANIKPFKIT